MRSAAAALSVGGRALARYSTATAGSADDIVDVAIVGAGMVGAAVAALLRHNPLTRDLRIAVLDRQPPPMTLETPQFPDLRVSTITPASIAALTAAGAWREIAPPASAEFSDMQARDAAGAGRAGDRVWDHAGPGHIRWAASDAAAPRMGIVVENRRLQAALLRSAVAAGGPGRPVEILAPAALEALRLPEAPEARGSGSSSSGGGGGSGLAELSLAGGRRLRARLVVGADGGASRVREMAGLRSVGWPYHQRGLVATVETSEPNATAWQRFLPGGPLALLPVRGGFSNIVWTHSPEGAAALEAMGSREFADAANAALQGGAEQQQQPQPLAALTSALSGPLGAGAGAAAAAAGAVGLGGGGGGGLGGGDRGGGGGGDAFRAPPLVLGYVGAAPKSFPLAMRHTGRYTLPRLALVGDAAHCVHPLAGQGVNLGLGDAAALADAVAGAREVGRDIGEGGLLAEAYESPRRTSNLGMMAALEALQRGFCGPAAGGPLGAARAAGLGAVNAAGPLRAGLMRYAMGLTA
ncbi:MAG: flavin-dependent monooxygenase [Monoraphidium minutum]|nr:MAG: flavin-dependent monooxygenase [Monoraphidium minutum]